MAKLQLHLTMPQRTRTRTNTYEHHRIISPTNIIVSPRSQTVEYLYDFYTTGGHKRTAWQPCRHIVNVESYTGYWYTHPTGDDIFYRGFCDFDFHQTALSAVLNDVPNIPFVYKFERNNGFGIFSFLAELDETIAMLGKRFITSLSYGGFQWGWKPLFNDLLGIVSSLEDLFERIPQELSQFEKRKQLTIGFTKTYGSGSNFEYTFNGKVIYHGFFERVVDSSPQIDSLLILLDELGAHPDLKLVWDTIPLSFVVDYFIPIGQILDYLHPRGWFNPAFTFTGSRALKGVLTLNRRDRVDSGGYTYFRARTVSRVYDRQPNVISTVRNFSQQQDVEWKAPSFTQLFNTLYVLLNR